MVSAVMEALRDIKAEVALLFDAPVMLALYHRVPQGPTLFFQGIINTPHPSTCISRAR